MPSKTKPPVSESEIPFGRAIEDAPDALPFKRGPPRAAKKAAYDNPVWASERKRRRRNRVGESTDQEGLSEAADEHNEEEKDTGDEGRRPKKPRQVPTIELKLRKPRLKRDLPKTAALKKFTPLHAVQEERDTLARPASSAETRSTGDIGDHTVVAGDATHVADGVPSPPSIRSFLTTYEPSRCATAPTRHKQTTSAASARQLAAAINRTNAPSSDVSDPRTAKAAPTGRSPTPSAGPSNMPRTAKAAPA
ncbi:hypothetical protein PHLGIDRAFT_122540, partial [Phlebiopsis gigantea 11061_1 CR5-6]